MGVPLIRRDLPFACSDWTRFCLPEVGGVWQINGVWERIRTKAGFRGQGKVLKSSKVCRHYNPSAIGGGGKRL